MAVELVRLLREAGVGCELSDDLQTRKYARKTDHAQGNDAVTHVTL